MAKVLSITAQACKMVQDFEHIVHWDFQYDEEPFLNYQIEAAKIACGYLIVCSPESIKKYWQSVKLQLRYVKREKKRKKWHYYI